MAILFRLLLTLCSILLSVFVFFVARDISVDDLGFELTRNITIWWSMLIYFAIVFLLSNLVLCIAGRLNKETLDGDCYVSVEIANDTFLPSYLGYFFVSLGAASMGEMSNQSFVFVFVIMAMFIFFSRISYFNPIFLLLRYNFFYITNTDGVKFLVITKRKIKRPSDYHSDNVRRINDYTFIDMEP